MSLIDARYRQRIQRQQQVRVRDHECRWCPGRVVCHKRHVRRNYYDSSRQICRHSRKPWKVSNSLVYYYSSVNFHCLLDLRFLDTDCISVSLLVVFTYWLSRVVVAHSSGLMYLLYTRSGQYSGGKLSAALQVNSAWPSLCG